MIRSIVFDLGNILLSWNPAEFFKKSGYDHKTAELIQAEIFKSSTWMMLDNGDISSAEAIESIAKQSSFSRAEISALFNLRSQVIFPLTNNIKLLPELKKQGFRLYYLSNFPLDFFDEVKNEYDFFKYFDGGIISAEVKKSKPDPDIYRIFLEMFSLDPIECLYIDDIDLNIKSAELAGMKVIHLKETDSLERKLFESGTPFRPFC